MLLEIVRQDVELRRSGKEWKGLCPFHEEKHASFYVNEEKQQYFCFGCGARGDTITYLRDKRGLTFSEALWVAGKGIGALPELPAAALIAADEREQLRREAGRWLWQTIRERIEEWEEAEGTIEIAGVVLRNADRHRDLISPAAESEWREIYHAAASARDQVSEELEFLLYGDAERVAELWLEMTRSSTQFTKRKKIDA